MITNAQSLSAAHRTFLAVVVERLLLLLWAIWTSVCLFVSFAAWLVSASVSPRDSVCNFAYVHVNCLYNAVGVCLY